MLRRHTGPAGACQERIGRGLALEAPALDDDAVDPALDELGEAGDREHRCRVGGGLTVFALAGGANLGAVQVGMLSALLEAGIRPDAVIGTSVGALNAAYLATDPTPGGMERLADLWGSLRRREVFPLSLRGMTQALLARHYFFFPSVGLRRLIRRARLGFARLEDAPIPLHVVATDLESGEAMVLSEGSVTDALLASAAIPAIIPPVEIGGRLLVDGGVVASIPMADRPCAQGPLFRSQKGSSTRSTRR